MYELPDYTDVVQAENASIYKGNIDEAVTVHDAIAGAFYVYEAATPDMTVVISAGHIQMQASIGAIASQTTTAFTAPGSGTDIYRIYVDNIVGTYSSVLLPAAVPPGKAVIADVSIAAGTTAITNAMIVDRRPLIQSFFIDEDDMISDRNDVAPTQQSTKAYVDDLIRSGWVDSSGGMTKQSGNLASSRVTTGVYAITHSFGHTNYVPTITPTLNVPVAVYVNNITSTLFWVQFKDFSSVAIDVPFLFQITKW